jgi:hypothetical protein
MDKLKRGKIEQEMMAYLLSLREKAEIETFLPEAAVETGEKPEKQTPSAE